MEVLHGEEEVAVLLADVVDLGDVRVIEDGGQPRLLQEHPDQLVVRRELGKDSLEDDVLLEALDAGRAREVDLRHATEGDPVEHSVLTELRARRDHLDSSSAHDSPPEAVNRRVSVRA